MLCRHPGFHKDHIAVVDRIDDPSEPLPVLVSLPFGEQTGASVRKSRQRIHPAMPQSDHPSR